MDDDQPYKILEFTEKHPYVLLAVIIVLVIMIIGMFIYSRKEKLDAGGKKSCKRADESGDDDDEIDELIKTIHEKQKKAAQTPGTNYQ
jgi:hypothetical protein